MYLLTVAKRIAIVHLTAFGHFPGAIFYAPFMPAIYEKYKERGGLPVFHLEDTMHFEVIFKQLYELAASSDYIRDMRINERLSSLLTLLMQESWNPENSTVSKKRMELAAVKSYLDEHYIERITLDELEARFLSINIIS